MLGLKHVIPGHLLYRFRASILASRPSGSAFMGHNVKTSRFWGHFGRFGAISRPKGGLPPKSNAKMSFLALFRSRTPFDVLSGGPYRPIFALGHAPAGARRRRAPRINMENSHKRVLYGLGKICLSLWYIWGPHGEHPSVLLGTYDDIEQTNHPPEQGKQCSEWVGAFILNCSWCRQSMCRSQTTVGMWV